MAGRVTFKGAVDFTTDGEHSEDAMSEFFVQHIADAMAAVGNTYDTSSLSSIQVTPSVLP